MAKDKVLFICTHNSARSQMAEEYLRYLAGDRFEVESAGLEPGIVNPLVVEAMKEEGIDLSNKKTQSVFDLYKQGRLYRYVVAVCSKEAEEKCPVFPGIVERLHWPFEDPAKAEGSHEEKLAKVRAIRNQINEKVQEFIQDHRV